MKKRIIGGFEHIRYERPPISPEEMIAKSKDFYFEIDQRRTVREIDTRPIYLKVMENIILTAS